MADQSDLNARLKEHADGLSTLAAEVQAELDIIDAQAKAKRADLNRINHAVRELAGQAQTKSRGRADKGAPRGRTVKAITDALRAHPEGLTYQELSDIAMLSPDTVSRTIAHLRSQEKVRDAGVGENQARVYRMMPDLAMTD